MKLRRLLGKRAGTAFDAVPEHRAVEFEVVSRLTGPSDSDTIKVFAAPGASIAKRAPSALASALADADSDLASCDHLAAGAPFHKPALSERLVVSGPYLAPLFAIGPSLAGVAAEAANDHAAMMMIAQAAANPLHLDRLWAATSDQLGVRSSPDGAHSVLEARHRATVTTDTTRPWLRIELEPQRSSPCTVVVPTRDGGRRLEGLIRSIGRSQLPAHTIVVDNDSRDPTTRRLLSELDASDAFSVLKWPGAFSFGGACNLALGRVRTPAVAFVNDDVQPLDDRWLAQLVANLDDPGIGAVGAQLLFPDGTIQHSGVVLGLGGAAGHPFRGLDPASDGYFGLASARREVTAVTAACLVARTSELVSIGGFDASFGEDFQDVDLCLRLERDLGLSTVVDPAWPLTHLESATRGHRPANADDAAQLSGRWGRNDRFYSGRLPTLNPGYSMRGLS